jgi:hypothetical protein
MKKLFFILLVFSVLKLNAADIYVNNSGQAGTYTTISAAITAAATGDRIFVSPYDVYTENLIIAKSLTITSGVANTRFSVFGSVTITSAPSQDVIIIGGDFSSTFTGNTGTATLATKGKITVSDCDLASFNSGNFIVANVLFCKSSNSITLRHGKIIGSEISDISIPDGPNTNTGDTIFIIGNKISSPWSYNNNDNYFIISNNVTIDESPSGSGGTLISVSGGGSTPTINNIFSNNYVQYSCATGTSCSKTGLNIGVSNTIVCNNIVDFRSTWSSTGIMITAATGCKLYNNLTFNNIFVGSTYGGGTLLTNNSSVEYSNGSSNDPSNFIDSLGRCSSGQYCVNLGAPSLQFYDIDLTINDLGTFGGSYSIDNYWSTANGRVRVYDLNMPFEIWNGSTPSIKAEGIHIK